MDDILVVDEDLVDINCDGNKQSDNKKGKHSSGGRMAKGEKKSKKKLAIIISSVAAVAVALGVAGFCIFGGNLFNSVEELSPVSLSFLTEQPFRVFPFREKHTTRQKKLLKKRKKALLSLLTFRLM